MAEASVFVDYLFTKANLCLLKTNTAPSPYGQNTASIILQ